MTNTTETKAVNFAANLSMTQLKNAWLMTEGDRRQEIPQVREWIMDAFEVRDSEGFNRFLETNDLNDIRGN